MTNDEPLVRLDDVTKVYDAEGPGGGRTVLAGVNLAVREADSLSVVGPSGSGKSTFLNIMGGLDRPTSGRMVLAGENLASLDEDSLALIRNRAIGFVFQFHHLLPQCTALENVLVPTLLLPGAQRTDALARAKALLERVGLAERMNDRPARLSGGERQRVAVVRALVNEPRLLLADEPTGSLDQASAAALADLLIELNSEQHVTLVVVTHSTEVARRMKRRYVLSRGLLRDADDAEDPDTDSAAAEEAQ